jgi:hypothetical protein
MMTSSEGYREFNMISTLEYVPGVHVIVKGCPATGVPLYVKLLSATANAASHNNGSAHIFVEQEKKMKKARLRNSLPY